MTTSPLKAFIFDWAGTMIDFGCCAPVVALQGAFAEIGIELSDAQARADMGMAKHAHIQAILTRNPTLAAFLALKGRPPQEADIDDLFHRVEPRMTAAAADHTQLIEGAAELAHTLKEKGVPIGSGTGYSRSMMGDILSAATRQGYTPECVVCAGETPFGRPSPLMTWKVLVELGVWPASACVKVDDAVVGITEGLEAGVWTIGVAASGNGVGLRLNDFLALEEKTRRHRVEMAAQDLLAAGAHFVVSSVADIASLIPELEALIQKGVRPHEFTQQQLRLKTLSEA